MQTDRKEGRPGACRSLLCISFLPGTLAALLVSRWLNPHGLGRSRSPGTGRVYPPADRRAPHCSEASPEPSRAGFWSTSQIPSEEQLLFSPASSSDVCFKTKDKRQFISNLVLCWESLVLSLLFKAALKGSDGPATRNCL